MKLTRHQRLRKLCGDVAAYVADLDLLKKEILIANMAAVSDVPYGSRRVKELGFREDAIYREARSLGVTGAVFMRQVDERASGPLSPKGSLRIIAEDISEGQAAQLGPVNLAI